MSDSLRDQLLGLGFKPAPARERKPAAPHGPRKGGPRHAAAVSAGTDGQPGRPSQPKQPNKPARTGRQRRQEDIDLAKAYAIRAQKEKDERIEAERQRQEQARLRREARARLEEFLQGRGLNDAGAEVARHFPYGGKIKRIYVNPEQLRALNAGELGVVQLNGRYLLVTAADLAEAASIFPDAVALKVDPDASAADDPYADPRYQVPDDLVW